MLLVYLQIQGWNPCPTISFSCSWNNDSRTMCPPYTMLCCFKYVSGDQFTFCSKPSWTMKHMMFKILLWIPNNKRMQVGINTDNFTLFYLQKITSLFIVFPWIRIHLKKGVRGGTKPFLSYTIFDWNLFWYSCKKLISSGLSPRAIVGARCLGCSSGRESTCSAVALSSNLAFKMVAIKYGMYSNDFSALTGSGCQRFVRCEYCFFQISLPSFEVACGRMVCMLWSSAESSIRVQNAMKLWK